MRGEVHRLPARGKAHEQRGRRYAVVFQPDWLTLNTLTVAFTSTSARQTTFRSVVKIADQPTLVMCDRLATVDLTRLTEPVGFLTLDEMQRVSDALSLMLDLSPRQLTPAPGRPCRRGIEHDHRLTRSRSTSSTIARTSTPTSGRSPTSSGLSARRETSDNARIEPHRPRFRHVPRVAEACARPHRGRSFRARSSCCTQLAGGNQIAERLGLLEQAPHRPTGPPWHVMGFQSRTDVVLIA